jgi:hypothetical protein
MNTCDYIVYHKICGTAWLIQRPYPFEIRCPYCGETAPLNHRKHWDGDTQYVPKMIVANLHSQAGILMKQRFLPPTPSPLAPLHTLQFGFLQ